MNTWVETQCPSNPRKPGDLRPRPIYDTGFPRRRDTTRMKRVYTQEN